MKMFSLHSTHAAGLVDGSKQTQQLAQVGWRTVRELNRDERGSISLASVFALILLSFLLGLVMNATRQADHRIKLQNAADASARSGGIVFARSLNTIAFTNHLTADVFALTAFFRESRDQNGFDLAMETLDHWSRIAPHLSGAELEKFALLGDQIPMKVEIETRMVQGYAAWALAMSETMLPVLEAILMEEAIPAFQRDLVVHTPRLLQGTVDEIVQRHQQSWPYDAQVRAVAWRALGSPVNGFDEEILRTIPVVDINLDPVEDIETEQRQAREIRDSLARHYLEEWNNESLRAFERYGKMSRFSDLWRSFTCGQLEQLLDDHRNRNLPMRLRRGDEGTVADLTPNERDYSLVIVVYAQPLVDRVPRIFENPTAADQIAFAQVQIFVHSPRLRATSVAHRFDLPIQFQDEQHLGGMPRDFAFDPPEGPANRSSRADHAIYHDEVHEYLNWRFGVRREGRHAWDSYSQNWETQLVPATATRLPIILGTPPGLDGWEGVSPPALSSLSAEDLYRLTHH